MLLLHLLSDPIQTWQKHLAQTLLLTKEDGFELVCFSCSDDVVNIMKGQIQFHFSAIFKKFCFFDTDYENYAIVDISSKKKIICGTESINMWI